MIIFKWNHNWVLNECLMNILVSEASSAKKIGN